ncbi:hypothetical protein AMS68_006859 [Peltaster fructicola]|uniref:GPI inositol-deacylase n=1 Tax=Peltaster fructicola TaxID=286661 RepID=A0A6H0Y2U6_9PEZI|nr:hypothetical protein AMS68_006859 [Peltaster fructicola]
MAENGTASKTAHKKEHASRRDDNKTMESNGKPQPSTKQQSPWSVSILTLSTSFTAITLLGTILWSFLHLQQEPKGCQMSYMAPMFAHFSDFDTEHTRFASKYSLHLYREGGIDEDTRVKGIPVVFIPGNAGSYRQVRPIAAEAATYYHNVLREDQSAVDGGKLPLDVFSVDFNEDITAFHGQTLLDQAEYLNDALGFILALYHTPGRFVRDADLPDPKSVIIIGHSMGGIVARTMLTMPNYQENTINTIITLSAPHARAPVSFDATMVTTYQRINDYWRRAHLVDTNNSLDDVSLVSVAGGGLDTMIPSEYTSVTSLVPESHGFTVFTSSIPDVWTSMDHLAIMWCDQFRKALVRSIFDVVDARRRTQTIPRSRRVASFQKRLLTGMEPIVQKNLQPRDITLIIDEDHLLANTSERLVLRQGRHQDAVAAHILAAQPGNKFTMMTNNDLRNDDTFTVLQCSKSTTLTPHTIDLSTDNRTARLTCTKINAETSHLPASTAASVNAFDDVMPFSYIQLDDLTGFVAVIERQSETPGWVIAEFSNSVINVSKGHHELMVSGLQIALIERPMMTEIKIPEVHSTLFAYKLDIQRHPCKAEEIFTPLLRQYIAEPYESKYFVNLQGGNINVHGLSPYMPPRLSGGLSTDGLSLQLWTDPACDTTIDISLKVDKLGSAGKIVMRYRTIVAVLPLLVVFIVIRKQFKVYDTTGLFISFSDSMDQCIKTSLPFVFLALTFLAVSLSKATQSTWTHEWLDGVMGRANSLPVDFTTNDLMLGTQDPFLWFLVPLFGIIAVGICIAANYLIIILMSIISAASGYISSLLTSNAAAHTTTIPTNPPHQRLITTAILLLLVTTLVPYQFAYVVLTMVQFASCVRGLNMARSVQTANAYNFYNLSHSFLLLMLWVLPINIPVLVVWIHNLAVHWMTPFSTHHNLLAILPLMLCVETMSTGNMIPRISGPARHITNTLTFLFALYAAVYGSTYAYRLHHLLNALSLWLSLLYFAGTTNGTIAALAKPLRSLLGMPLLLEGTRQDEKGSLKKRP